MDGLLGVRQCGSREGQCMKPVSLLQMLLLTCAACATGLGADRPYGLTTRPRSRAFLGLPADEHGPIPDRLSATGAFDDTRALRPAEALIPYDINAAFWSDGASKRRWVSVPCERPEKVAVIRPSPTGSWDFPPGTVFVKHFELVVDETRPNATRRLETRLLVRDVMGGVYGISYRWRDDGADADLVREPRRETYRVISATGPRKRSWYFPGPADCRQCHTPSAGGVLGVSTRQLNRDLTDSDGCSENQLRVWSRLGLFDHPVDERSLPDLSRMARPEDRARSLEDRARSFLDVNCSQCHRPGGVTADFDARYDTPLAAQGLIAAPARINLGIDGARLIAPNDPWRSILLNRVNTLEPIKMPPLAHEVLDREAVLLLEAWIKSIPGPPVAVPPIIRPEGGDFRGAVRVTLSSPDPDALICYTLDGTAPGKSSPVYAGPFELRRSTTVRARAYRDGFTRSISVQETFIIDE
jgi:uncharacterized repeat protein (TIGR03806 family)